MLSREERLKLWDELERRLSSLVMSLTTQLDEKDRGSVLHFIDHNEYGLALEELYAALKDSGSPLLPEQAREVELLAEKMGLSLMDRACPRVDAGPDIGQTAQMDLSDTQFKRYARHLILDEVGEEGQEKLLQSRVLMIGAGGLGSPALMYLAAAGIGTIGIADNDTVDLTNLQRQIVHTTDRVGQNKVESAIEGLAGINPEVRVVPYKLRIDATNALALAGEYDVVIDGSDNFATRYLLNDACYLAKKPLVAASLLRFEGQLSTFKAHDGVSPCYRCVFPDRPPAGAVPRCEEAGILGAVAGVMGTLQAVEAIKELLGLGDSLAGALLIYDALSAQFRRIKIKRDPHCALCGVNATIHDLSAHRA